MADDNYDKKFAEMQKYLPFLQKVIEKLKINSEQMENNPRKGQLEKMEMLHDLLTNKGKKLKMETLLKCEGVLIKLHTKMEKNDNDASNKCDTSNTNNRLTTDNVPIEVVDIVDTTGPASPPPQQIEEEIQPVEIPTERQCSPLFMFGRSYDDKVERRHKHSDHEHRHGHRQDGDRHYSRSSEHRSHSHLSKRDSSSRRDRYASENSRDTRVHNKNVNEVYSPEKVTNDKGREVTKKAGEIVINLVDDSPTREIETDLVILDNVLGFKKQNTNRDTEVTAGKRTFERLGLKRDEHGEEKHFENFKINVSNDLLKAKKTISSPIKTQAPKSIPSKVPSIPDVLKSPPLTASDISNLLNESEDKNSVIVPSILDIGTRRPPKSNVGEVRNSGGSPTADLDAVRKKLAIVSRNSPQLIESPASPVPMTNSPLIKSNDKSNERLALKYHPHHRVENRPCLNSPIQEQAVKVINPPTNVNVLPTINPNDPRLKRTATVTSSIPQINNVFFPPTILNRNNNNFQNEQINYGNNNAFPTERVNYQDPRSRHSYTQHRQFPDKNPTAKINPLDSLRYNSSSPPPPAPNISGFMKSPIDNNSRYRYNRPNTIIPHDSPMLENIRNNNSDERWESSKVINAPKQLMGSSRPYAGGNNMVPRAESPEENWESEPETDAQTPVVSKEDFKKKSNWAKNDTARRSGPEQLGPDYQKTTSSNRFSALLNDKTERDKYYESKKQKHVEPRTYAEFKQAKARVIAEEAAKKAAEETKAKNVTNEPTVKKSDKQPLASKLPVESTLDKLYRSSNFSGSTFPKTNTSFKIPKKVTNVKSDNEKTEISGTKKCENQETVEVSVKENEQQKVHRDSSNNEKVVPEKENIDLEKRVDIKKKAENKKNNVIPKKINQKEKNVNKSEESSNKAMNEAEPIEKNENISDKSEAKDANKPVISTEEKLKIDLLGKTQAKRITKRRNTMFVLGSRSEIDKEKLNANNSLVFEDLQSENKISDKSFGEAIKNARRSKNLAEIFQKTDDNCTVSTQNIISGKRRTRTTVNFNEIDRVRSIFQQKKFPEHKREDSVEPKDISPKIATDKQVKGIKNADRKKIIKSQDQSSNDKVMLIDEESKDESNEHSGKASRSGSIARSTSGANTPTVMLDGDSGKCDLLENFVNDILKPNADTEYVFTLLGQILTPDKLELVKTIIKSAANENKKKTTQNELNDSKNQSSTAESSMEEQTTVKEATTDPKGTSQPREKRLKKRTELDRLNEDIRDMFISSGVLTATGRRMCTLVAEENNKKETTKTTSSKKSEDTIVAQNKKSKSHSEKALCSTVRPRIRKSKVVLSPINVNKFRRSARLKAPCTSEDSSMQSTWNNSEIGSNSNSSADVVLDKKLDENNETSSDLPCMPLLKPNTPIRLTEIEEKNNEIGENEKTLVNKFNNKKRKPIENNNKEIEMPKPKQVKSEVLVTEEVTVAEKTNEPIGVVKNTNPKWHSMSEYVKTCVVCQMHINFPGMHYQSEHSENYVSRLPPSVLEKVKTGTINRAVYCISTSNAKKYFYRCVFCLHENCTTLNGWSEHFGSHTSEYNFVCSLCQKGAKTLHAMKKHLTNCKGGTSIKNRVFNFYKQRNIVAYVCHLCNFLQLTEKNLHRHYVEHHEYSETEANTLGYTVTLLDIDQVECVDVARATELKSIAQLKWEQLDKGIIGSCSNHDQPMNIVIQKEDHAHKENSTELEIDELQYDMLQLAEQAEVEEKNEVQKEIEQKSVTEAVPTNVFMPTREINDSPTFDRFAERLLQIDDAEKHTELSPACKSLPHSGTSIVTSIAERLTQRFKDLKEANETTTEIVEKSEKEASPVNVNSQQEVESVCKADGSVNDKVVEPENITVDAETVAEDDDNWEDIEIVESAPSTCSSIVSAASSINKDCKLKTRNVFSKFNRFFAAKPTKKVKKGATFNANACNNSINSNKPDEEKEKSLNEITNAPVSNEKSKMGKPKSIEKSEENTNSNALNFRPMIATLEDLLPDSPCNDPIDLVPELASLEPLQDLNDISSILDPHFSIDLDTAHSICINTDSQQTSIQEALDFVSEQQQQYEQQTISAPSSQASTIPSNANIQRIQNVGFFCSMQGDKPTYKFYCLSEQCTFLYSSEAFGLESHYYNEHTQAMWKGYCDTCKAQVVNESAIGNGTSVLEEIKHMLDHHAISSEASTAFNLSTLTNHPTFLELSTSCNEQKVENNKTSNSPTTFDTPKVESNKTCNSFATVDAPKIENNKTYENVSREKEQEVEERPRIKLRRLTGDCLSANSASNSNDGTINANSTGSLAMNDNTILCDLLNAKPRVSSKPMVQIFADLKPAFPVRGPVIEQGVKNLNEPVNCSVSSGTTETTIVPAVSSSTSNYPLQITSVMSLSDLNIGSTIAPATVSFPKISNVRSLHETTAVTVPRSNINNDTERTRKTAESTYQPSCESSEPLIVSETLPVGQVMTGDFLLTQTVSAKYHDIDKDTEIGFNISIAANPSSASSSGNTSPTRLTKTINTEKSVPKPTARPYFICQANNCKYQTRVGVAMADHLRFHERRNFVTQRDYLRCGSCDYMADDINDYFQHADTIHLGTKTQVVLASARIDISGIDGTTNDKPESETSSRSILTNKIKCILNNTQDARKANKPDGYTINISEETLAKTVQGMVEGTGISLDKLFRCAVDSCSNISDNAANYQTHLLEHLSDLGLNGNSNFIFNCPYKCSSVYHRITTIKSHVLTHAQHRYFCYRCMKTEPTRESLQKHFTEKHWRINTIYTPAFLKLPTQTDGEMTTYYVGNAHLLGAVELQSFGEKLIAEWQRRKAALRTHFKPSEVDLLPMQPILPREIFCADCLYKTKVRTNMLRHLQAHRSNDGQQQLALSSVDPVNPVPCLTSNERHFDKMTNLASSSLVPNTGSSAGVSAANGSAPGPAKVVKVNYAYQPENKRYICGVAGCNFLTIADENFRTHLNALHSGVSMYQCAFCKEEICKRSLSVERILQHLRYHGPKLYQCEECSYVHYMRTVVDRHIQEKHALLPQVNLLFHERAVEGTMECVTKTLTIFSKKSKEVITTKPATPIVELSAVAPLQSKAQSTKSKAMKNQKWICDLCAMTTSTQPQMAAHCNSIHGTKQQYQCSYCEFSAQQLPQISAHIDECHEGKPREARYLYHRLSQPVSEKLIDTTPLWQRDDPKRVRHIRGILMEDEEESERYRKRLRLDDEQEEEIDSATVNTEEDINAELAKKEAMKSLYLGAYEFGCLHCDYKSNDLVQVQRHSDQSETCKPSYFRLLQRLRCPHCENFNGNYVELQRHLLQQHHTRQFAAADWRASTKTSTVCAYCDSHFTKAMAAFTHHRRVAHNPHDLKYLPVEHLTQMLKLGAPVIQLLCGECGELHCNHVALMRHRLQRHADVTQQRYTYHELSIDELAYRCGICPFASTDERTTLRHMIDHYGQFRNCHYCNAPQLSFDTYMEHCYAQHREGIQQFQQIYTFKNIKEYLLLMVVVFPNGLHINKKNLHATQYGDSKLISDLYQEICQTARQPPIPRLSIARLVARKSIEAKERDDAAATITSATTTATALQLASGKPASMLLNGIGKKISKRRSTVAFGINERQQLQSLMGSGGHKKQCYQVITSKKVKLNTAELKPPSPAKATEVVPYSYYGKTPEEMDLSNVYTCISIAGVDTPIKLDKFRFLFKIDAQVRLRKLKARELPTEGVEEQPIVYNYEEYCHSKKACPASQKYKYM